MNPRKQETGEGTVQSYYGRRLIQISLSTIRGDAEGLPRPPYAFMPGPEKPYPSSSSSLSSSRPKESSLPTPIALPVVQRALGLDSD